MSINGSQVKANVMINDDWKSYDADMWLLQISGYSLCRFCFYYQYSPDDRL